MSPSVMTFQHDLPSILVGAALCAIAAGLIAFTFLGRDIARIDLPIAGLFAASYGIRLILTTNSIALMLGNPTWLHYVHAALQYIVPIPGAILFERFFGERLRPLNRALTIAFILCAVVGIPYEAIRREPGALLGVNNAIVLVFLAVYFLNTFLPVRDAPQEWRILRTGILIFGIFVLNAHFHFVDDRYGLTSEPVGFLILIGTIVSTLVRHTVRAQMRVAAVDGELAAARRIQMSIIPVQPPQVAGLDLAAIYKPASEVAGDFFDFLVIDKQRLGILVADVSGHGVPAALVASMLKVVFTTHTAHAGEPARLLRELNVFFCGKLQRQFITAAYVLIDAVSRSVRVASAGHPPPLIVRRNGSIEELCASGVLIGRFRDATYAEAATGIGNGDAVVLYTDGIPESRNASDELWGDARFREAAASSIAKSASAMAEQIIEHAKAWNARQNDDITLVIAKCVQS